MNRQGQQRQACMVACNGTSECYQFQEPRAGTGNQASD
ncbi:hypothetical protein FH603_4660 [Spirosoma sp. LMG 31447]|uniref:Uncharacterized protein n=1 Tax=Spirosoma utsteinense TaxID=2585773 RepID=A0ABR6WC34_9BACT|nr:hypothetical protein [Spirosoma utsteinense]